MDCFGVNRATLFDSIERAINFGVSARRQEEAGQMSLFHAGSTSNSFESEPVLKEIEEQQLEERCSIEKSFLGFYMTRHPLEIYSEEIDTFSTDPVEQAHKSKRSIVSTAGLIVSKKIIPTKRGEMAFVLVEGRTGTGEVVVFNDVLQKYADLFQPGSLVFMDGEVSRRRGDSRFSARKVFQLKNILSELKAGIVLRINGNNPRMNLLQRAIDYMKEYSGNGEVVVDIRHGSGWRVKGISRSIKVYPESALMNKLRELLGNEHVMLSRGKGPRI